MGQGAYVKIINTSGQPVSVGYWGIECMYQGGEDGSNFGPIQTPPGTTLASGSTLPPTGTQYLEAIVSGSCAFNPSTFNMNFDIGSETATFYFDVNDGDYGVSTSAGNEGNRFAQLAAGGATFDVFIVHNYNGSQDLIVVTAYQ